MNKKASFFLVLMAAGALATSVTAQHVDTVLTNGLFEPHSIAVDSTNNFYITDGANNRIVKYIPSSGALSSLAGGQAGSADGRGVLARFFAPKGIVVARGGLVVADSGNHTLRFVTFNGVASTLAGAPGQPGLADGPAAAARFSSPIGLAADASGNIFIADSKNNAIRKLDLNNNVSTFATGLYEPAAVAIGENGEVWVADTRNHTIKVFSSNGVWDTQRLFGSNSRFISGSADALNGANALFNNPRGLLFLGGKNGILVSDSGNHTLRRIFFNPEVNDSSVETFAGVAGESGFVNAPLLSAKFSSPIGLGRDLADNGFVIVDLANNAVRRIQLSPPQPPVSDPVIGYVVLVKDPFGDVVSRLVPVTQSVFNNDIIIAILAESATETFFTFGPTGEDAFEDNVPEPSAAQGLTPPHYENGLRPGALPPSMISPQPDVTIKAISTQDGRRPSQVVRARFQFKTANPVIVGDNAASFVLQNQTENARMFFTLDGTDPVEGASNTVGPIRSDELLSLNVGETNLPLRVRAFRNNFQPSEVVEKIFSPTNFTPNRISFGFDAGEASSDFVASAGQRFFAPVTLSLLPNQSMFSLQFNLTVTNIGASPPFVVNAVNQAMGFESMLVKPKPGVTPPLFITIDPMKFVTQVEVPTNIVIGTNIITFTNIISIFTNLTLTNFSQNLLLVGWLERFGRTNLYNTREQDLITFSLPHDTLFESKNGKVVLGALHFTVPPNAGLNQNYQISLGRPSATSDGIGRPGSSVFIHTPTNGSLAAGPINTVKRVTVGQRQYLVGDVAPFRWFNAGDFGDTNLLNDDVMQIFQSAVYGLNLPVGSDTTPRSDFFDAMDASNGTINNLLNASDGNDTVINTVTQGDGVLLCDDVFVVFRRSLDRTLVNYARFWSGGVRQAVAVPNTFRGSTSAFSPSREFSSAAVQTTASSGPDSPSVRFEAGEWRAAPGQTVSLPIKAQISGNLPVRVLMLNLNLVPLDGAPQLSENVRFTASSSLGQAALTLSRRPANYAAAWLNASVPGLAGSAAVGTLTIQVPAGASPTSAYKIEFEKISASPNGLGVFPQQVQDGLLTLADRSASSLGDGIPDTWRLRHFGTVHNWLSHANADADGDGVSNWEEFKAGTIPNDIRSALRLAAKPGANGSLSPIVLRFPSVANKRYVLESADSLSSNNWRTVSSEILGTGGDLEFTDSTPAPDTKFYRVRLVE